MMITSKRDQKAITKRILEQMDKAGLDVLFLTSPYDVFYATGLCPRGLYVSGCVGSTAAIVTKDGTTGLVVSEFEKNAAIRVCDPSVQINAYPVWIYIEDYAVEGMKKEVQPDLNKTWRMALEMIPHFEKGMKVGAVYKWLSKSAAEYLAEHVGAENLVDCYKVLSEARTIKTPWEIDVLRYNTRAAELAMNLTARDMVAGMTPADLQWIFEKHCMDQCPELHSVGHAHTFGSDFTPSYIPSNERLNAGDLVRLDGGPYAFGYKSDLGRTYAIGGFASADKIHIFEELWKGYEYGIKNIGPGVKLSDLFRGIEASINLPGYVRGHFGHSISCDICGEEYPFIAPNEDRVFEPGMVFCLETPYYSSKHHTYNIEDTILITEDGIEMFSQASPTMFF